MKKFFGLCATVLLLCAMIFPAKSFAADDPNSEGIKAFREALVSKTDSDDRVFRHDILFASPFIQSELEILKAHQKSQPVEHLQPVLNTEQVLMVQKAVREVRIEDEIHHYILDILEATRNCSELLAGVSPRGGIAFTRAVQAAALMDGRDFVVPDDVKELAVPVLAHRVILETGSIGSTRQMTEGLIEQLLASIAVPG